MNTNNIHASTAVPGFLFPFFLLSIFPFFLSSFPCFLCSFPPLPFISVHFRSFVPSQQNRRLFVCSSPLQIPDWCRRAAVARITDGKYKGAQATILSTEETLRTRKVGWQRLLFARPTARHCGCCFALLSHRRAESQQTPADVFIDVMSIVLGFCSTPRCSTPCSTS